MEITEEVPLSNHKAGQEHVLIQMKTNKDDLNGRNESTDEPTQSGTFPIRDVP